MITGRATKSRSDDPEGDHTSEHRGGKEPGDTTRRREPMNEQSRQADHATEEEERTWTEQIEVAGSELVGRTKELIAEGNVRHLIIRNSDDDKLLEVPLTTGVVVGGAFTLIAPILAALGAMAALLSWVKIEVVRTEAKAEGSDGT